MINLVYLRPYLRSFAVATAVLHKTKTRTRSQKMIVTFSAIERFIRIHNSIQMRGSKTGQGHRKCLLPSVQSNVLFEYIIPFECLEARLRFSKFKNEFVLEKLWPLGAGRWAHQSEIPTVLAKAYFCSPFVRDNFGRTGVNSKTFFGLIQL